MAAARTAAAERLLDELDVRGSSIVVWAARTAAEAAVPACQSHVVAGKSGGMPPDTGLGPTQAPCAV